MKIVVLDGYTCNPGDLSWDMFTQLGSVEVHDRTPASEEIILERIGNAEIVLTNKTELTESILKQLPGVRYIGVLATGYNVVDVKAARARGIIVTNVPGYSTEAVAQMTFALLLEICHHAGAHSDSVFKGEWSGREDFCYWNFPLIELSGKTLGIIGFGRIGQTVARIARSFGLRVLVNNNNTYPIAEQDAFSYSTLGQLLREADVISLHCPLTEVTREIINKVTINQMKDGVIIINTSRGPLVNETDLASALNSGKISAAALDVVSIEPILPGNPLLKAKNCIITPHIAWAPKEARARLMKTAAENLRGFISGCPVNAVN